MTTLTMRKLLSIMNGIFDPLGLTTPFTTRLSVAFQDLFRVKPPLNWDDIIPQDSQKVWKEIIIMMSETKEVSFPRATKPHNAVGKSQLICYFDGSDHAFAAVI